MSHSSAQCPAPQALPTTMEGLEAAIQTAIDSAGTIIGITRWIGAWGGYDIRHFTAESDEAAFVIPLEDWQEWTGCTDIPTDPRDVLEPYPAHPLGREDVTLEVRGTRVETWRGLVYLWVSWEETS